MNFKGGMQVLCLGLIKADRPRSVRNLNLTDRLFVTCGGACYVIRPDLTRDPSNLSVVFGTCSRPFILYDIVETTPICKGAWL